MTNEKDITDRSLGYGMGNESKKPEDASSSYANPSDKISPIRQQDSYSNGNFKLDLDRRVGESPGDYHLRLFAIRSTQIELIRKYEKERSLDRYRKTDGTFRDLLEGNEDKEGEAKRVILNLQRELTPYLTDYPEISSRESIREKLEDFRSLN